MVQMTVLVSLTQIMNVLNFFLMKEILQLVPALASEAEAPVMVKKEQILECLSKIALKTILYNEQDKDIMQMILHG